MHAFIGWKRLQVQDVGINVLSLAPVSPADSNFLSIHWTSHSFLLSLTPTPLAITFELVGVVCLQVYSQSTGGLCLINALDPRRRVRPYIKA